eukprot:TCALIF_03940-PA protein Name:"Protein of unknown function" AED:0.82 eAED:0.82 QI:0/0/0/0.33/1/1/3/0/77
MTIKMSTEDAKFLPGGTEDEKSLLTPSLRPTMTSDGISIQDNNNSISEDDEVSNENNDEESSHRRRSTRSAGPVSEE